MAFKHVLGLVTAAAITVACAGGASADDKVVKNRIHLDFRPDDQQAEVDRVIPLLSVTDLRVGFGRR